MNQITVDFSEWKEKYKNRKIPFRTRTGKIEKSDDITLAEKLYALIVHYKTVSFAEITKAAPDDFLNGQLAFYQVDTPNTFLWSGMTQEACDAVRFLLDNNLVKLEPCNVLVYLYDGGVLNLPIAKRVYKYKSPHWFPVVFNPVV